MQHALASVLNRLNGQHIVGKLFACHSFWIQECNRIVLSLPAGASMEMKAS